MHTLYACYLNIQCDKEVNPQTMAQLRSKELALQQMEGIAAETTTKEKKDKMKAFGIRDTSNCLYKLSVDLFQ